LTLHDGACVRLRSSAIASGGVDGAEILATVAGGGHAGRAAYVRLYGPRAEMTLDVVEGFWHRGAPAALLDALVAQAAREGMPALHARCRRSVVTARTPCRTLSCMTSATVSPSSHWWQGVPLVAFCGGDRGTRA